MANKTVCPITKEQFRASQKNAVDVKLDNFPLAAMKKEFSTGSLGWYGSGRATIMVDGVPVQCQVGLNITIIGSKPETQSETESSPAPKKGKK